MLVFAGFAVSSKVNAVLSLYAYCKLELPVRVQLKVPLVRLHVLSMEPLQVRAGVCATAGGRAVSETSTTSPNTTSQEFLRLIELSLIVDK